LRCVVTLCARNAAALSRRANVPGVSTLLVRRKGLPPPSPHPFLHLRRSG
jgi:hypothetical protein